MELLRINPQDPRPIYLQIVQGIKLAIARGSLKPHGRLPSIRSLALKLLINPNTIARAYRELEDKGIIYTKRGEGSFVSPKPLEVSDEEKRGYLGEVTEQLVAEAKYLSMSEDELLKMVRERFREIEKNQGGEE